MLFSYVSGQQQVSNNKKCRRITGNFDCHADAAVRRGVHCPIEHIQGFTGSHWMPPLGMCLRHIASAAAMIDGFVETTLNTTKTQLLHSNYGTFWSLVVCLIFKPETDHLLSLSMRQALIKCETPRLELKSLRSFLAIKHWQGTKSKTHIKLARSSLIKGRIYYAPIWVFMLRCVSAA